jgi:hypothetical protein
VLDLGADMGIVEKSGAWYSFEGERIGQGRENVKKFLSENVDILNGYLILSGKRQVSGRQNLRTSLKLRNDKGLFYIWITRKSEQSTLIFSGQGPRDCSKFITYPQG